MDAWEAWGGSREYVVPTWPIKNCSDKSRSQLGTQEPASLRNVPIGDCNIDLFFCCLFFNFEVGGHMSDGSIRLGGVSTEYTILTKRIRF